MQTGLGRGLKRSIYLPVAAYLPRWMVLRRCRRVGMWDGFAWVVGVMA